MPKREDSSTNAEGHSSRKREFTVPLVTEIDCTAPNHVMKCVVIQFKLTYIEESLMVEEQVLEVSRKNGDFWITQQLLFVSASKHVSMDRCDRPGAVLRVSELEW